MTDVPIVVGINRTQDGSIAVALGRSAVFSLQKERISRRKHHWGRLGDVPDRYLPHLPVLRQPVDLVVEGYSSDTEIDNLEAYRAELRRSLRLTDDARIVLVSRHTSRTSTARSIPRRSSGPPASSSTRRAAASGGSPRTSSRRAPGTTSSRSVPSTAVRGAGSTAWPSNCGTATGRTRPVWAASTRC